MTMQDDAERLRTAVAYFQSDNHLETLAICRSLFQGPIDVAAAAYQLAGLTLNATDRLDEASTQLRRSILIQPTGRAARINLAVVEQRRGRIEYLERQYQLILFVDPACADAWHGLSSRSQAAGEIDAASRQSRRALLLQPSVPRYLEARADLALSMNDAPMAAGLVKWAFITDPFSIVLARKAAGYLGAVNAHPGGLAVLKAALFLNENADLRIAAGYMLRGQWRNPEAVDHFRRALILAPAAGDALLGLMWCRRQACDWDSDLSWLSKAYDLFLQTGQASPQPAFALAWSGAPAAQLAAARSVAGAHLDGSKRPIKTLDRRQTSNPRQRIKIGYLTPHFGEHPVGRCIIDVIERHDRARFEIHAYASKDHGGHEIMRRARSSVEHFRDLDKASEAEIHERIMADGIEILIDLDGYSQGLPSVIARRPAPILVNFLGYAGTSGGLHDYLISDRTTILAGTEEHYAEKIIWMPECFLPPPTEGTPVKSIPSRKDEGLPENALVLAAFHTAFKITPEAFDAWCQILRQVPAAVLWMLDGPTPHAEMIRAAALRRGVSADRLLFARFRPSHADHLARLPLADLYLDTFPHTAHSTAAELMFQGCPLVTRTGDALASRVGASVLRAAGAGDLVTGDWTSFVQKAVELAVTPGALTHIRQRLKNARATSPLFDRDGYARALENGFTQIVARHRVGQCPASIEIPSGIDDCELRED
jgi:protein O-GlcNAc transferase